MGPMVPFEPLRPKRVLGIVAHPDDLDVSSAATMAKYIKQGAEVHYLILTDGGKGSDDLTMTTADLIKVRQDEQRAGLAAIGGQAENVHFLNYKDGELEVTINLKRDIVRAIRLYKPDVVVTLDPTVVYSTVTGMVNHTDHRAAGLAVIDAVFPLARDRLTFPELEAEGLTAHRVETLLLVDFDRATYYEDVTDSFNSKLLAIRAHPSQFGVDTTAMEAMFTEVAKVNGRASGHPLAEGFIRLNMY